MAWKLIVVFLFVTSCFASWDDLIEMETDTRVGIPMEWESVGMAPNTAQIELIIVMKTKENSQELEVCIIISLEDYLYPTN